MNKKKNDRFHCCATCINFKITKSENGINYFCSRLSYETKPNYKFNCWDPKENIIKLMNKEKENN